MSLNFKIWLGEVDAPPPNLTPQQNVALAKTMAQDLAEKLPKIRPGAKVNPQDVQAGTLKKAFTDPKLKTLDPKAIESGVALIMKKIPGIKI